MKLVGIALSAGVGFACCAWTLEASAQGSPSETIAPAPVSPSAAKEAKATPASASAAPSVPSSFRADAAGGVRFTGNSSPLFSAGVLYGGAIGRGAVFLESAPSEYAGALLGVGLGRRSTQGGVDVLLISGVATKWKPFQPPGGPQASVIVPVLGARVGAQLMGAPAGLGLWLDYRYEPERVVAIPSDVTGTAAAGNLKFASASVLSALVRATFDL